MSTVKNMILSLIPLAREDLIGGGKVIYEAQHSCGHVMIVDRYFRGHDARLLFVNDALESAAALEEGGRQTLLFPYMKIFDAAVRLRPELAFEGKALLIGGGGCVYADHFLHMYPKSRMDVVEISEEIVSLARKYFSLGALESEPSVSGRLRLLVTDGISALLGEGGKYDILINDAFSGRTSDAGLSGIDGIILAHAHLSPGGLYILNLVSAVKGPLSRPGRKLRQRFLMQFQNVLLLQADEDRNPYESQNCVLVASDSPLY